MSDAAKGPAPPIVPGHRLVEPLGEGGMGVVWLAIEESGGREVALKLLSHAGAGEAALRRFRREFRAARRLEHPHVARVFELETSGPCFYTMERVEGVPLDRYLAADPSAPGAPERLRAVLGQLLVALDAVHAAGLVHRDVKPANVLVATLASGADVGFDPPAGAGAFYVPLTGGERPFVKLVDFGLAALGETSERLTRTGTILGTLEYLSPEQVLGGPVDGRTDLYAVGVILYEQLAGRPPFLASESVGLLLKQAYEVPPPPSRFRPGVDPGLEALALKLLAKEPADRFCSAREALRALTACGPDGRASQVRATRLLPRCREEVLEPRLVGRGEEIELASRALAAGRGDAPRAVLFLGEAGGGKTRLLDELRRLARAEGFATYCGTAHDQQGYALAPLLGVLDGIAGDLEGQPVDPVLQEAARVLARLVPRFAALAGPAGPAPAAPAGDAERFCLLAAASQVLRAAAAAAPVALFLDDLHAADPLTLDVVAYALRDSAEAGRPGLIVIATARDDEPDPASALARWRESLRAERLGHERRLERLDRAEVGELAASMLGIAEVPEEVASWLWRESQGIPFVAVEQTAALALKGLLVPGTRSGLRLRRGLSGEIEFPDTLPPSVADLVRDRIERLGERERRVAAAAALIGPEVPFDLLEAATEMGEDELLDAVEVLLRRRILAEVGGGSDRLAFTAAPLRELLARDLFERRRRRIHARVAAALEARREKRPEDVVALARHWDLAGEAGRALAALEVAIDFHARRFHPGEAAAAARRALELMDGSADGARRLELLLRAGDLEASLCRYERARDLFLAALARATGAESAARAELGLADLALRLGDYEEAGRRFEAIRGIDDGLESVAVRVHTTGGRLAWHLGRLDEARERFERAHAAAERSGDLGAQANALHNLGYVDYAAGRYGPAQLAFERSLDLARAVHNPLATARNLEALAGLEQRCCRLDSARARLEEALPIVRRLGDRRGEAYCRLSAGNLAAFAGQWRESLQRYDEAEEAFAELGEGRGTSFSAANRGRLHTVLGEFEQARRELERALETALSIGDRGARAEALLGLAELARESGDPAAAAERDGEAIVAFRELGDAFGCGLALAGAAATALAAGDDAAARAYAAAALEQAASAGGRVEIEARAGAVLAELDGDPAAAQRVAEQAAAAGFAEIELVALTVAARIASRRGQAGSEAVIERARACFERLASRAPDGGEAMARRASLGSILDRAVAML